MAAFPTLDEPITELTELREKTLSGMKWVFLSSFSQRVIGLVTTIFLARLLMPSEFGLFALAFVMIDGFGLFKSLGFDTALLRWQGKDAEEAADTAFLLVPFFGMTLTLTLHFFAPYGASLLGNPEVTPVIRMLAFIFIFSCLAQVPGALIQKRLDFWQKATPEIAAGILYSVSAVTFAFRGFGVWSLVYAYLLKTILYMSMIWIFAGWRPRFRFRPHLAAEMFQFGKFIFLGSLLGFLRNNLDNFVVGKMIGLSALGYYAIAFNLAAFLSQHLITRMQGVFFPVFSKIQEDTEVLRRGFLKSFKMTSIVAIPFSLFLLIAGPNFLETVYGSKWAPAGPVLRILALAGLFRALGGIMSPVFLAKGRSRLDFVLNILQAILFFLLMIPAAHFFGLEGVGVSVLVSSLAAFVLGAVRLRQIIQISIKQMLLLMKPAFVGSGVMLAVFGALSAGRSLLGYLTAPAAVTAFIVVCGLSGIVYFLSVLVLDRDVRIEVRRIV